MGGYLDRTLAAGATRFYRAIASNPAGDSPPSESPGATIPSPAQIPAMPAGLSVTPAGGYVSITWQAPTGSPGLQYRIERSRDGTNFGQLGVAYASDGQYTDFSAQYGSTYSYRLLAIGSGQDSAPSISQSGSLPQQVPYPPDYGGFYAWRHQQEITVFWNQTPVVYPADRRPDGYYIYVGGTRAATAGPNDTSVTLSGLATGPESITVTAYNTAGESAATSEGGFVLSEVTGTAAPTLNGATIDASGNVTFNWSGLASGEQTSTEVSADGLSWQGYDGSPLLGVHAYFRGYGWYSSDGSFTAYSNTVQADAPVLPAPSGLTATDASPNSITLNWTANAPSVTRTLIERGDGTSFALIDTAGGSDTSYTDTTAQEGTHYVYRIRVSQDGVLRGYSDYAAAAAATTGPSDPIDFTATSPSPTEIDASWTDTTDTGAQTAVDLATDAGFQNIIATQTVPAGTHAMIFTGLPPATEFHLRLRMIPGPDPDPNYPPPFLYIDQETGLAVDLLVDAPNDLGFQAPDGSALEEALKHVPYSSSTPGKVLVADGNDLNANGLPDYMDWASGPSLPADTHFAPFLFEVPATADLSTMTVEFDYNAADPAASGSPPGDLRLWLKDATSSRSLSDFIQGNTPIAASTLPFAPSGAFLVLKGYMEDVVANGSETITAKATTNPSEGGSGISVSASDYVFVDALGANLDITKTDGSNQALDASKKNTSGGYVVQNDDNDNGAIKPPISRDNSVHGSSPQPVTSITPLPDQELDVSKKIVGEHDLLPIVVHVPEPRLNYKLVFGTDIRVWAAPDRSMVKIDGQSITQVKSDTLLMLNSDTTFYVEGIGTGAAAGDTITLKCAPTPLSHPLGDADYVTADTVTVHVFDIAGPQYVPQYGTYTYQVTNPAAAAGKWRFDSDGSGTAVDEGTATSQSVTFPTGAARARVLYDPAAGFEACRYVYVVGLSASAGAVTAPTSPPAVYALEGAADQVHVRNGPNLKPIPGDQIHFNSVLSVEGWFDNNLNTQRGTIYMQAGFAQVATVAQLNGVYSNGKRLTNPMEGHTYDDGATDGGGNKISVASLWPWYDSSTYKSNDPAQSFVTYDTYNDMRNLLAKANPISFTLNTVDRPGQALFQTYTGNPFASDPTLTNGNLINKFTMAVGVRTLDASPSANTKYYQLATVDWSMDFSGTAVAIPRAVAWPLVKYTVTGAGIQIKGADGLGNGVFATGNNVSGVLIYLPPSPTANIVSNENVDLSKWGK